MSHPDPTKTYEDDICSMCEGTRKVVTGRGTEDEEIEDCPECSYDDTDMTGASDYKDGGNNR